MKVADLLAIDQLKGYTVEDLRRVVDSNDKQRFHLEDREEELYIRANQGHTLEVKFAVLSLLVMSAVNKLLEKILLLGVPCTCCLFLSLANCFCI